MRTFIPAPILALIAVSASGAYAGDLAYDFTLVESFNPSYDLAETFVVDINEQNVAIGTDTFGGFRWTADTGKIELPSSGPRHINNNGEILYGGSILDPDTGDFSFLPDAPHPYPNRSARAMNDLGVVVGHEYTNGSGCEPFNCPLDCAFNYVYDPVNGARNVDVPNLRSFRDVNNSNIAVGVIISECDNTRGVVYDLQTDEMINLSDQLPPIDLIGRPAQVQPVRISDGGHVIGTAIYGSEPQSPFVWTQQDGFTFLAAPEGANYGYIYPSAVNAHGVVIGEALDEDAGGPIGDWRAVIWITPDNPQYLDELITDLPAEFLFENVYSINDNGWITGSGHFGPGWATQRGVVLKPLAPDLPGDLDQSGTVDLGDLNMVLANFGTTNEQGDATGDGQVDLADLNLVLANFGSASG